MAEFSKAGPRKLDFYFRVRAMAVANSSPVNPVVFFDVSIGGQVRCGRPGGPARLGRTRVREAAETGWARAAEVGASELRGLRSWTEPSCVSRHLQEVGRMKIELFADVVPKTAENFR